jgi:hypothetical protein
VTRLLDHGDLDLRVDALESWGEARRVVHRAAGAELDHTIDRLFAETTATRPARRRPR